MNWWSRFLRRKKLEHDLSHELAFHVAERIGELQSKGLSEDEARRRVRQEFGGLEQVKEECRTARGTLWLESLVQDLRYAGRTLRKSRGFSVATILTLALGIGAATTIFSVVEAVLLRALPYPDPQNLVSVREQAPNGHRMSLADPNFEDFLRENNTFETLAEYTGNQLLSVVGGNEPARVNVVAASRTFFNCIGVEPLLGRPFASGSDQTNSPPAAVVSHAYWQQHLGRTTDLSKFRLRIEGMVLPVAGVMPAAFDFPSGVAVWVPRDMYPRQSSRTGHNFRCIGRIRRGVTVAQARANLSAIAHRIRNRFGNNVDLNDASVVPLADALVGDVRTALLTLAGAVGLLLLIACANVAGLLVARISARRKELAVRAALGSGRRRLVQQFLVESLALSLVGGAFGVFLALWMVRVLPAILPANLPRQQNIAVNAPVLLFALIATIAVAGALGLFGAWRAGEGDVQDALTAGSRSYSGSVSGQRLRGLVVAGEIAMTLAILVGAGLLGRSFLHLIGINPGFNRQNLITMEFSPPRPGGQSFGMDRGSIARQAHLMENIMARLRAIPGVTSIGLAGALPVAAGDNLADGTFLLLNGQKSPANFEEWERLSHIPSQTGHALYAVAGEAYFRTVGIPLIRGRMFGDGDDWNAPHVAVISQSLAQQRWPKTDPIGQLIHFGNMDGNLKPLRIIGVAGDVRASGLNAPPSPIIYVDYRQRGLQANSSPTVLIRSAAPTGQIVPAARSILRELAPEAPAKFSTFEDEMDGWLADRRFLLLLVGFFAAAALALAAVGLYGVVAFAVARRTQEIGICMALGAQRRDILRLIISEGARLVLFGVALGVMASLLITRALSSLLFGISATDPITFVSVSALLCLVSLVASYVPARRAMRLHPSNALRYE